MSIAHHPFTMSFSLHRHRLGKPFRFSGVPILASSSATLPSNFPAFPSIEFNARRCAPRIAES